MKLTVFFMYFFFFFAIQISPSGNLLFVTFAQFSSVSGKVAESSPSGRRSCFPGGCSFPHAIACLLVTLLEPSIHTVTSPVLAIDPVGENTGYPFSKYLLTSRTPGDVHSARTPLSPDLPFASRMVALGFAFSRFLKVSVFSRSQVDPNISQTLAT